MKELTEVERRTETELVADHWSLVRERMQATGLCLEGWYSEHLGVCRRAELLGRSVKVKKF